MKVEAAEHFEGEFRLMTPAQFRLKALKALDLLADQLPLRPEPFSKAGGEVKALADVEAKIMATYERVTKRAMAEMQRRILRGS